MHLKWSHWAPSTAPSPFWGEHAPAKTTKGSHEGAPRQRRSEAPSCKSIGTSKKAQNGAANLLPLEGFVLKGSFTRRLFSSCQDHRNPQDTLPEKCWHCTNRLWEGRFSDTTWALPSRWCRSGAAALPFLALFLGHMPLLPSFCCGFPNVMLLEESFAASWREMTSPFLSSISLIQKAAFKAAFQSTFLVALYHLKRH